MLPTCRKSNTKLVSARAHGRFARYTNALDLRPSSRAGSSQPYRIRYFPFSHHFGIGVCCVLRQEPQHSWRRERVLVGAPMAQSAWKVTSKAGAVELATTTKTPMKGNRTDDKEFSKERSSPSRAIGNASKTPLGSATRPRTSCSSNLRWRLSTVANGRRQMSKSSCCARACSPPRRQCAT